MVKHLVLHASVGHLGANAFERQLRRLLPILSQRTETVEFRRITVNPHQMDGVPCIRGLRIPVSRVVDMVAGGMTIAEIVGELPDLEPGDIPEALRYAAEAVRERELPLLTAS